MKTYVAGRWCSWRKVRDVQHGLSRAGCTITFDWTAVAETCVSEADEDMPKMAELDLRGVREADFVVVLLEPGCRGAYLELGYAMALGIPAFVVAAPTVGDHVFFHHPDVTFRWTTDPVWGAHAGSGRLHEVLVPWAIGLWQQQVRQQRDRLWPQPSP